MPRTPNRELIRDSKTTREFGTRSAEPRAPIWAAAPKKREMGTKRWCGHGPSSALASTSWAFRLDICRSKFRVI